MATGRGGPRRTRFDVTAKPLAGGGAGGGEIYIDPRYSSTLPFRDDVRRARGADTAIHVAGDLHETLSGLDVSSSGKNKNRAAVQQFIGNLQRAVLEHSRAPEENLLDPYKQAFTQLATTDPEKAAALLGSSGLPLTAVQELGSTGFKTLLASDPRRVVQAMEATGMRPEMVRALLAAPDKATAQPAPQQPQQAPKLPVGAGPGYVTIPSVDVDPVIPARPARSPIPIQRGDETKVLAEPGADWTPSQIARGWRATTVAPYGVPAVAAPRASSVNTEGVNYANTYIERQKARLEMAVLSAGGQNTKQGSKFKSILENSDALTAAARQAAEADFDAALAQRRQAVEAAKDPAELAEAKQKLYLTERQRADHLASFDAMSRPAATGGGMPAQGPGAPRRIVEVIASRWQSDLKPTPAMGERPNPTVGQERATIRPVAQPASPLVGLRRDVATDSVPAHTLLSRLGPEERQALERAQDLAAALKTGRQISMGQEIAPGQVEGMQQVPLAQEAVWFDNTPQARDLNRAIGDITRRFPALAGLIDTGPALAPSPRGPLAPLDRGDFQVSLSSLMGGWDNAKPFFFEDRPSNVPPAIKPLIKQAENVAALERITGKPFVAQLPAESSTVGALNKGVTREDLPEGYDQMTPKQQKAARKRLEERIEGSVGDRPKYGVNDDPGVSRALRRIDEGIPLGPGRRIDLDEIEKKYPAVVAEVRAIMAESDAKHGGPVILRNQTRIDTSPSQRRSAIASARGKLPRLQEQLVSIIEGNSKFMPTVLRPTKAKPTQGLVDEKAKAKGEPAKEPPYDPWSRVPARSRAKRKREGMEMVARAIEQGGIYPLDENASYWRGKFVFLDPDDGNVYYGRLTPGVLARTISQQLLQDSGKSLQALTDMIKRSIQVYERLPPTKAAAQFVDEKGAPRTVAPTKTYMKAIEQYFEERGLPFSPIIRMDPLQEPPAPPQGKRRFVPISPITGLTK